jgi:hypothetical protein
MWTKLAVLALMLHVAMTLMIGLRSFKARVRAINNGSAKLDLIEADSANWPRKVRLLGNNFDSQFDSPMMWYAVTGIAIALGMIDPVFVALSFLYLLARLGHSIVHISGSNVPSRARIFLFSFFVIVAMWLWLTFKLFVVGSL